MRSAIAQLWKQLQVVFPEGTLAFLYERKIAMDTALTGGVKAALLRWKDETPFPVEYTCPPVRRRARAERLVGAQHAITRILAEAADLQEASPRMLRALCEALGWHFGELWLVDADAAVLRCADVWHTPSVETADFAAARRRLQRAAGVGLVGRVWATAEPVWVPDLTREDSYLTVGPLATRAGLHAAIGFPVRLGADVLGVIAFASREVRESDEELLDMMAAVGSQVGQFIERKRGEAALRAAEGRYRSMFEHARDGIFQMTADGSYLTANPALARIHGYPSPVELMADPVGRERRAYADPERRAELLRRLHADGVVSDFESQLCPKTGEVVWISENIHGVRDTQGEVLYYEGSVTDVTGRRAADQMKADFMSFTTHQLRTPLSGIKWLLELATHGADIPEETRSYIQAARDSADRLTRLVNRMLEVSRLETGTWSGVTQPVDLAAVTRAVLDESRPFIAERGHHVSVDADHVASVSADPELLRQAVLNLVSNAIKYTSAGGHIDVRIQTEDGTVCWSIRDTGIGIPEEARSRLFEKFYRADNAAGIETDGTGLGLHLVRLILHRFGGDIRYDSEPGRGTTFYVTLPAARSQSESVERCASRSTAPGVAVLQEG
jgi:PAS domain S-box-containing protein